MRKVFFTLRDFSMTGGGGIRINGLLETLVANGVETTLICQKNQKNIHCLVEKKEIDLKFTTFERRVFHLLLSSSLTFFLVDIFFKKKLSRLITFFKANNFDSKHILFFEYLDSSIAYYLKRKNALKSYSIDIHGVAHIEFNQLTEFNFLQKLYQKAKYFSSLKLDKKVFTKASAIIFASHSLRNYIIDLYPNISEKPYQIIPYLLSNSLSSTSIDQKEQNTLMNRFSLTDSDQVVFFAGDFSKIGGLLDLVNAFNLVLKKKPSAKLFLVGKGGIELQLKELIKYYKIEKNVIFAGTVPYKKLYTYQSIANVIVCPDTENQYSNLIIHIKYFDSLRSGKIVINGSFSSVKEINKNDHMSISFKPSDVKDLSKKILFALDNQKKIEKKYKKNQSYIHEKFQYNSYYKNILEV